MTADTIVPLDLGPSLVERFERRLAADGLTLAEAGRQIGVSPTLISQWRHGTYPGDGPRADRRVERWLELGEERAWLGGVRSPHVSLGVTDDVVALLTHAQAAADLVLVFGAAGAGKTHAARWYEADGAQVWLATMSPAVRTPLALLTRIAAAVGVGLTGAQSAARVEDALVAHLEGRQALLIIDEAHHLSQALLDELRCLHDRATCGLALVGNEPLWPRLVGGERAAQIVSRIGPYRLRLGAPSAGDGDALAAAMLGRSLTAGEGEVTRKASRRAGGLRGVVQTIHAAHAYALGRGADHIGQVDLAAAAEGW